MTSLDRSPRVESLEVRRLLSAVYPSNTEQYLVELVNRGRADPSAEAARYDIALNEGLAAGTISASAKQPLAINPYVTDAARDHSQWMIDNDQFAHAGADGSQPNQRMSGAGYNFVAPWTWGENIAWRSYNGSASHSLVAQLHKDLFVDAGIKDRGHRTNLMNGAFREIGAGYVTGNFKQFSAGMLTTDFGSTAGNAYLTGVVYDDGKVTDDDFYTPGEGLAGVKVTATRRSDSAVFSTTSWSSGGYALPLPGGSYDVAASGGALGAPVSAAAVSIGSENVKRDFLPGFAPAAAADLKRPTATLTQALRKRGTSIYYPFVVTYNDNVAVNPATFGSTDILITGPKGFNRNAAFNSSSSLFPGTPLTANYSIKGPGGSWDHTDNGIYTITLRNGAVGDTSGRTTVSKVLGQFSVIIPAPATAAAPAVAAAAAPAPSVSRFTFAAKAAEDETSLFA
jgi:uncharacterized protein YkwD